MIRGRATGEGAADTERKKGNLSLPPAPLFSLRSFPFSVHTLGTYTPPAPSVLHSERQQLLTALCTETAGMCDQTKKEANIDFRFFWISNPLPVLQGEGEREEALFHRSSPRRHPPSQCWLYDWVTPLHSLPPHFLATLNLFSFTY